MKPAAETSSGWMPMPRTQGRPLEPATRAFFERRFDCDFSSVRVHDDSTAAHSIGASAFTRGDDIVTGGRASRELLAHELAHVVQQRRGSVQPGMSTPGGSDEVAAERAASAAMHGEHADAGSAPAHAIQRNVPPSPEQLAQRGNVPQPPQQAAAVSPVQEAQTVIAAARLAISEGRVDPSLLPDVQSEIANAEAALREINDGTPQPAMVGGVVMQMGARVPTIWGKALVLAAALLVMVLTNDPKKKYFDQLARSTRRLGELGKRFAPPEPVPPPALPKPEAKPFPAPEPKPAPAPAPRPAKGPKADPILPPVKRPDPDTDEDRRKGCRGYASAQRGGNNCHDDYAFKISGTTRDYDVMTPDGLVASYDGRAHSPTLYEVKTGYGFLLGPDSPRKQQAIARMQEQAANQQLVADRCGYDLIWFFNEKAVAELMSGLIQPRVRHVKFKCTKPLPPEAAD
jgi:hypothetical protein